jgi:hypothetical protein
LPEDFDLLVDGMQRGEDWFERSVELTGDLVLDPCVELRCRLVRRTSSERLEDSAHMIDHGGSRRDQQVSRSSFVEVSTRRTVTVLNGVQ